MPLDAEDRELIIAYQQTHDPRVGDRLLIKFQRWCAGQARKASAKFGLTFDEAMQASRIGLLDAVEHFDLERENGLLAYATSYVRKHIAKARFASVGGVSQYINILRARIGRASQQLRSDGVVVTDEAIAMKLGVRTDVVTAANMRSVSMDSPLGAEDDGSTLHDLLAAPASLRPDRLTEDKLAHERLRQVLRGAIATSLTERNAQIVMAFLDADCEMGAQSDIAMELGVTRQRVSLAVAQAMPMLQRAMRLHGYGRPDARELGQE